MADPTQNPQGANPQSGTPMPQQGGGTQSPQGGQLPTSNMPTPPPSAYPPGQFPPGAYPQAGGFGAPQGAYPAGAQPPASGFGASPVPQGGFGGMPMPPPGSPMPPPQPEDNTPANFQLGTKLPPKLNVPVPQHALKFDEQYFLRLLAGSISLTKDEKKRIIESIPKLKQAQIDELIKIFEDEKRKFAELSKKYTDQLEKLAQKHYEDWMDLETSYKQQEKASHDAQQADEIRKKLGLG